MFKKTALAIATKTGTLPALRAAQESLSPRRRAALHERVNFYRQFVPDPGTLVFDIGANMGNRSEAFLKLGARVVAVEPQAQCTDVLARRFGHNPKFSLIAAGAGSQVGTGTIRLSSSHVLSSMSEEWTSENRFGETWLSSVPIRITTLDALISVFGTPRFCKIDVEGFETDVLRGLSTAIATISIEYNPALEHKTIECIEMVAGLGQYEFAFSPGEPTTAKSLRWSSHADIVKQWQGDQFGDVYARIIAEGVCR